MASKKIQIDRNFLITLILVLLIGLGVYRVIANADSATVNNSVPVFSDSEDEAEDDPEVTVVNDGENNPPPEPEGEALAVSGDAGDTFTVGGHEVKLEGIEYRDEDEAGMDGFNGLAGTGKLLWVGVLTTNNSGQEQNYNSDQYSMVGLSGVLEAYMNTGGMTQPPFTLVDGGQKFYYLIFDNPQIDGQPVFRWSPPGSTDRIEITLPDATEISGYN